MRKLWTVWILATAGLASLAAGSAYWQAKKDARAVEEDRALHAQIDEIRSVLVRRNLELAAVALRLKAAQREAVTADARADSLAAVARKMGARVVVIDSTHVTVDSQPAVEIPAPVVQELRALRLSVTAMTTARDAERDRADLAESVARRMEQKAKDFEQLAQLEHQRAESFRKQIPRCGAKCGAVIGASATLTLDLLLL